MKTEQLFIENTPAVLYGEPSDTLWLFVHGQFWLQGRSPAVCRNQWLRTHRFCPSTCLESRQRQNRNEEFAPWTAAPELTRVMALRKSNTGARQTCARPASGAYFARLAFAAPEKALFVSPIVDMERLICDRICTAGITEQILRRARHVSRKGRDMLSWDYLCWVRAHPAKDWYCPQYILYGENDSMTDLATIRTYIGKIRCGADHRAARRALVPHTGAAGRYGRLGTQT